MADDDIYENKAAYERFVRNIPDLATPLPEGPKQVGKRRFWCRNPANLAHFHTLAHRLEICDLSYVRRLRLMRSLLLICNSTQKSFTDCTRDDIDSIVQASRIGLRTPISRSNFIKDVRRLWRTFLPERDSQGRPDETLTPYVVRHLSAKIERSKERLRDDKITVSEFERLLEYFAADKRLQCYLSLAVESLRRPQELLYTRIRDAEIHDNFAKVRIASHGKEGPGLAQCIDSYPYLVAWLREHPLRSDPNAYLFVKFGTKKRLEQLRPEGINKQLRKATRALGLSKRITCYSIKRNGVTIRRLRGDSDVSIQRAAGWTSTKQIKTYDLSDAEDAFKVELVKRGIVKDSRFARFEPAVRSCTFCGRANGIAETICSNCKRPLDRKRLEAEASRNRDEQDQVRAELTHLRAQFSAINAFMNRLTDAHPEILETIAKRAVAARTTNLIGSALTRSTHECSNRPKVGDSAHVVPKA